MKEQENAGLLLMLLAVFMVGRSSKSSRASSSAAKSSPGKTATGFVWDLVFKPADVKEAPPLTKGDFAKVAFFIPGRPLPAPPGMVGPAAERLWLKVVKVTAPGRYIGTVENNPLYVPELVFGQKVAFNQNQIFETEIQEGAPR